MRKFPFESATHWSGTCLTGLERSTNSLVMSHAHTDSLMQSLMSLFPDHRLTFLIK